MNESAKKLLLTSSKVAGLLDVQPSTVKRWCDEGALRTERTGGGHRRIRLANALATARDQGIRTFLDPFTPWEANVWLAVSEVEERGSFRRLHTLALGWLANGNTDLMGRLLFLVGDRAAVSFPVFLEDGIRAFMALIGEEWQKGRLGIGEEHMASQIVMEVLLRLRPGWDDPGFPGLRSDDPPPVAVVGAMEGDHHDLGSQAVRVLLEREGWRVYFLGANVPVEEFAEVQRVQGAALVCISFSPRNNPPDVLRAVRVLSEFYRPEYPYALGLGGSLGGFTEGMLPDVPFESLALSESTQDFLAWIRTLLEKDEVEIARRVA
jgi:excisionase family DNA binding protein